MTVSGINNTANLYTPKEADSLQKGNSKKQEGEESFWAQILLNDEDSAKLFDFDKEEKNKGNKFFETKNTSINMPEGASPKDSSPALTQRLVAALGQFQVRQVIADANKELMSLQAIAAGNGKDAATARAYIRKIEKLLARARRKLDDLDKEDALKIRQVQAEKLKQEKRLEEIKEELRKRKIERRARENGYLLEDMQDKIFGGANNSKKDAMQEAEIAVQAEAISAAETAVGGKNSAAESISADVSTGTAQVASGAADSGATAEGSDTESFTPIP